MQQSFRVLLILMKIVILPGKTTFQELVVCSRDLVLYSVVCKPNFILVIIIFPLEKHGFDIQS